MDKEIILTVKDYFNDTYTEKSVESVVDKILYESGDQYSGQIENLGYKINKLASINANLLSVLISKNILNKEELSLIFGIEVLDIK